MFWTVSDHCTENFPLCEPFWLPVFLAYVFRCFIYSYVLTANHDARASVCGAV